MYFFSFDEAWDLYLRAGPLLPRSGAECDVGTAPKRVSGVAELLKTGEFDAVVLDAYGILHTGDDLFPEAVRLNRLLRETRMPFCVLTNGVSQTPEERASWLAAQGFRIDGEQILSGRSLLGQALEPHNDGKGFALLASNPGPLLSRFPDLSPCSFDEPDLERAKGFVLVDTNSWMSPRPGEKLAASLKAHPRPLIVCNPDVTCPYQGKLSCEPGAMAFPLLLDAPDVPVTFLGKPNPEIYDLVRASFPDIQPKRILAVGDTPQTDILGARNAGFASLLIEKGFLNNEDALARCAEAGIFPDFIAAQVRFGP